MCAHLCVCISVTCDVRVSFRLHVCRYQLLCIHENSSQVSPCGEPDDVKMAKHDSYDHILVSCGGVQIVIAIKFLRPCRSN